MLREWPEVLERVLEKVLNKKIETIKSNKLSKEEYLKEFNLDKILAGNYKAKMIILIKKAINHNKDIKFQYFENISKTPFEEIQEKLYMFFNKLSSHLADNKITTDLISEMVDNIILKGLI